MKLKRWELALICGFVFTLLACVSPIRAQQNLAESVTRLHVIAASDKKEDQELKLRVRDVVLKEAEKMGGMKKEQIDENFLARLRQAGQAEVTRSGYDYKVDAEFTNMYFTTRVYDTFSMPAGYYDAVRVTIGPAKGKNWWCVLLPPLCDPASSKEMKETARKNGMSEDEICFITKDGTTYAAKFKIAELYGQWKHLWRGDA